METTLSAWVSSKLRCYSRVASLTWGCLPLLPRRDEIAGANRPYHTLSGSAPAPPNNRAPRELWSPTVAVGTTIADRPPHRSVRARLRIRLLRRMSGVEACIGIGVQNAGWRNPPVQDWGKTFPTHLCALTAADQNTLP